MVVIAITGATGDIGYNVARELVSLPDVTKVIVTSRTAQKGEALMERLTKATGKDASCFGLVTLDLNSLESIKAAVESFPEIDRMCLNAGGMGRCKMHEASGATDCMVMNTVGHAMLVDGLLSNGKIKDNGRIVYVGSEVSRDIYAFAGLMPNTCCGTFKEKDINEAITNNTKDCLAVRAQLHDYKQAKRVGHMYFASLAKELQPRNIHVMSVSPGAVGGGFVSEGFFPLKAIGQNCVCLFRALRVSHTCFTADSIKIGVQRYVDVLATGAEEKWPTGSSALSAPDCFGMCFWGAWGPMEDNRPYFPYLKDEALCDEAAKQVRACAAKWEKGVASATMDRAE